MTWIAALVNIIAALYFLLLLFYFMGWQRLRTTAPSSNFHPQTFISVIIPARNEAQHIASCLEALSKNHYPKELLEIILIDDFSEDDTVTIARQWLHEERDQILRLKDFIDPQTKINSYKKKALSIALLKARGELIVTTDADCISHPNWLLTLAFFKETTKADALVAPVSFSPNPKKSILYYFQSIDFMTMQGITGALTALDIGSMSNGANLGFTKTAFESVGGYQGVDQIASGDDMFLLHKIKTRFHGSITYVKRPEAIVETPCQPGLPDFINQRIRWASKSDKYKDKIMTLMLGIVYLFNLSLLILAIAGFFHPLFWQLLLYLVLIKIVVELTFLFPVAQFYNKTKELWTFPFLQPFHILYIVSVGFLGKFGKYQWKGRKVK